MRTAAALLLVPLLFLAPPPDGVNLPEIQWNDHETSAGELEDGRLAVDLEVRRGDWYPLGEEHPSMSALAFAEAGESARAPGPMIRVPEGTEVVATVTNPLDKPLEVQGLASRRDPELERGRLPPGAELPWVRVSPGETETFRFSADRRGTYFYRARVPEAAIEGEESDEEGVEDGLLSGALIVDAPGESPREHEKVMIIQHPEDYLTINGRPYPHTERLVYDMGDEPTYRVINATEIRHPMHLHGHFFTLKALGDIARDTVYGPTRQKEAVTHTMPGASTMKIRWTTNRPGGWIFHCHLSFHMLPNPPVQGEGQDIWELLQMDDPSDPHHHAEHGVGGMVMGIYVRRPEGWTLPEPTGEPIRLHVREDSTPGHILPRFGYALGDPGEPPPAGEVPFPGPPIVLHAGEPALVRVVNETDEPTTVHWHGLELPSLYDGVAGATGYHGNRTPAVMPGDSFDNLLRTDRPGTYLYHSHLSDVRQQGAGLYGPLIILPEGEEWTPETDRIYMVGEGLGEKEELEATYFLNGERDPESTEMTVGTTYRLRLINIGLAGEATFRLARQGFPVEWRPLELDAWRLPAHQRDRTAARKTLNVGETFDVTYTPQEPGELAFQVEAFDEVIEQRIQVNEPEEEAP